MQLLAVLPDRLKATVVAWLQTIPLPHRQRIETVCTDMWEGYVTVVQGVLPKATLLIDRFHVACHYRDAVDTLRKQELRRGRDTLPKEEQEVLDNTLWLTRKRPAELDAGERERLEAFLAHSPQLKQAYALREGLTAIFEKARSKADGLRRIRFWCQRVRKSGLRCFDPFLKLLDRWLDLIANYFVKRKTSSFVEGLNNKLKVLKRRCYGIGNVGRLFQRFTLDLDGYRRYSPWRTAHH